MTEDHDLLARLRCGEKDALRRIYEKYRIDLFTIAASLLHDVHAAEDCLQDVFVGLADSARDLKIRRNLKGYLISWVVNRARDKLRGKLTQLNHPGEESWHFSNSSNPAQSLIDQEESVHLFKALHKLPEEQREVFVLHAQGGMKFREIAKLHNISMKTVQSRYRYAIKKLRSFFTKETEDEIGT
jgi:RNA polymerase sigma-70 factor (ECF subfamily)